LGVLLFIVLGHPLELDGAAEHHHGHVAGSSAERRHQVFAGGVTSANTILR